ncbi:MAG: fumarylacetoacetate hydrolase family protein [Pseudomonadota bacterium]|nr:fumarylacetoacetate hydrolase family protein [Pseudomonadota bacterium]
MKLVTLDDGTPDGRLHVVSRDGKRVMAPDMVQTLQAALDTWDDCVARLQTYSDALNSDDNIGTPFDPAKALSPLPRAWQWLDGSAFATHMELMQKAWDLPRTGLPERPLMYQGISDRFLPPHGFAPFPSIDDGIDFEGEYGVILGPVPMGTKAEDAGDAIRLVVQINDWSLRAIGPIEMATGFGWLQCKPACAVAPIAVTPDELGEGWRDHRVCLPLQIDLNGTRFGAANGEEMAFGFDQLVAHAAYSRHLPAGTILGSGTVANANYAEVGSSCIAERKAIEQIRDGRSTTPFLKDGDRVEMSVPGPDGTPMFGTMSQIVRIV